jgi:hypothetical protein
MACSAAIIRRYKTREQGFLASRGFQRTLEGWRNARWIGHVSRDGGVNLDLPRWQESSPEEALLDTHGRCKSRHNRTGTSVTKIRRELAQIWRLMLALRIDEVVRMIEQVEPPFDDVPPANARRLRAATQLLRAVGFAYQDDSLAVLPIALSLLGKGRTTYDNQAALWLRRRHWLFRVVIAFRWSLPDLASLGALSRTPDCWE